MVCVGLSYHFVAIHHDLVALALVLVIFTIFAAVRLHVQLVRFGRLVWRERAFPGRAFGFTCVMRHLNHAKTNRTSNGARTKKWWLFKVDCTPTRHDHYEFDGPAFQCKRTIVRFIVESSWSYPPHTSPHAYLAQQWWRSDGYITLMVL